MSIESNTISPTEPDIQVVKEEKWTNVQVDSQVLSSFMGCAAKYNYVFNRHLVPISGVSKSIEKGQLGHIGLKAYWSERLKTGDYQVASIAGLEEAKKAAITFKNLEAEDALDCFKTLVEFFKFQQSQSWLPVFVEQHFKIVAYEDPILKLRIILTGRIDLGLKTTTQNLIPVDNKTEAERWFYTSMSNQFKIYCIACKVNTFGVQRMGFQKTLEPEKKFKLEMLPFDQDILEEWRTITLPYWVKKLLVCYEDGYWPMNTTNCVHGHFACQFSDKYNQGGICAVSPRVREQKIERYFTVGEPWDPSLF